MEIANEIYNWLQRAFEEQVDMINETYFFDKRDNQFYSIFITDFLLIDDEDFVSGIESPYKADQLSLLKDRINRKDYDNTIISVPRLTIEERKQMRQQFVDLHIHASNRAELLKIIESENGRIKLDFQPILNVAQAEEWKDFKKQFFRQKADWFCNLNNIDIEAASL